MNDILGFATRLRAMSDAQLTELLCLRAIIGSGISDFFDLAEALLEHTGVQKTLSRLDRRTLALLATAGELGSPTITELAEKQGEKPDAVAARIQRATDLMLAQMEGDKVTVFTAVTNQLRSWPTFGLPSPEELNVTAGGHAPTAVTDKELGAINRLGAERAFTATAILTALLLELERGPARELAKGGVSLPDRKRLANAISTDLDTMPHYLAIAEEAGLAALDHGAWLTTEAGNSWLLDSTSMRWRTLAEGWLNSLLPEIRRVLDSFSRSHWGETLRAHLGWLYPAGGEWMSDRIITVTRSAELLGITANDAPSEAGALLLAGHPDQAEEAVRPLLPAEVEKVYLQHDLSVVAPGPLTPAVDARMRLIADVESRALAATYRVSASSVNRALASGETAAGILSFLSTISLTGIPQPLDYLVSECAGRYGLVRVGELSGEGAGSEAADYRARTYLHSDDSDMLRTIAIDQSLASLGLTRTDPNRLVSRFALDTVFWSLSDARYPVAAENSTGSTIALQRKRVAAPPRITPADPAAELLQRLRVDAAEKGSDGAWLVKRLAAAVRHKTALTISVTMPGGETTELLMEPAAIAGGRLRGRDLNSDTERTLPLSSIAAIEPAP